MFSQVSSVPDHLRLSRHDLDLDGGAERQAGGPNCCPRRIWRLEIARVNRVHRAEILHIREVDGGLHHIVEGLPRRFQHGGDVGKYLLGLNADVAGDKLAGRRIKRDLAAEKEEISSTHSGGKGSYRRRDPVGRDCLSTHVIDLLPRLKSSILRSSMQPPSGDLSKGSSRILAPPVFRTPPRPLVLFVLICPNLGDRLAVVAPGFGGDFLHDDKKRQDRSPQNLPQYGRRFPDHPRSVFHRTSGDRADYRLDTDKT